MLVFEVVDVRTLTYVKLNVSEFAAFRLPASSSNVFAETYT